MSRVVDLERLTLSFFLSFFLSLIYGSTLPESFSLGSWCPSVFPLSFSGSVPLFFLLSSGSGRDCALSYREKR